MYKVIEVCKGGGYRYCRTLPLHPRANSMGLYPLHRVLMENKLGRSLSKDEHVHHLDHDATNDSLENLAVLTASEHGRLHNAGLRVADVVLICPTCSRSFGVRPHFYRLRKRRVKRGLLYCSRKCMYNHPIGCKSMRSLEV